MPCAWSEGVRAGLLDGTASLVGLGEIEPAPTRADGVRAGLEQQAPQTQQPLGGTGGADGTVYFNVNDIPASEGGAPTRDGRDEVPLIATIVGTNSLSSSVTCSRIRS